MRFWFLLILGCVSSFQKLTLVGTPTAKEFPEAERVVLLEESIFDYRIDQNSKKPYLLSTYHDQSKLLKVGAFPNIQAFYDNTFTQIISINARGVLSDGTEKEIDTEKRFDRPVSSSYALYENSRKISVDAPLLPVNSVLESTIVEKTEAVDMFTVGNTLGSELFTLKSRVIISLPVEWSISFKTKNDERLKPLITESNGIRTYVFELNDVKAQKNEEFGRPRYATAPSVIARLESWNDNGVQKSALQTPEALSAFLFERYEKSSELDDDIRATALSVVANVEKTPLAQARALYEYACRSVEYCAVEIGYGGWFPHAATAVHKNKFGDCKDKANYLRALLRVVNIESAPTTIYAHDGWAKPFVYPSLGANFNHAILAVKLPEGTVYADPTWRTVPFGELPLSDIGATVLEMTKDGSPLKTTPEPSIDAQMTEQDISLKVGANGFASGTFQIRAKGQDATTIKSSELSTTDRQKETLKSMLLLRRSEVQTNVSKHQSDMASEVQVEGTVTVKGLIPVSLKTFILRPNGILDSSVPHLSNTRTEPVAFRSIKKETVRLALDFGAESSLATLPKNVLIDSGIGHFEMQFASSGTTLSIARTAFMKKRVFETTDRAELANFIELVEHAESLPLVVHLHGAP
jgi:Domain of Unknown Function with PDB structure (DUF3857)/Transglutaminase-like superfamily